MGVVHPGWDEHNLWKGFDKPTGDLVVPAQVLHKGVAYDVVEVCRCCFLECNDRTSILLLHRHGCAVGRGGAQR